MATIDTLLETTIPLFLDPVPERETVRTWLDSAGIPKFKANPLAKRGAAHVTTT
jgi:hypothetical protein